MDMKKMLEEMMMKEDSGNMSDSYSEDNKMSAKMEVIQELIDMASEQAGSGVDEMHKSMLDDAQKVTVMADDKESLLEGLDKAEDVIENSDELELDDEEMEDDEDEDDK